jgi:hypothetical protein
MLDFAEALGIKSGERKLDLKPAENKVVVLDGWRAEEDVRGYNQKQFHDEFGCTIAEAGYKQLDLTNAYGQTYKGVLMIDDAAPYTKYVRFREEVVMNSSMELTPMSNMYRGHGESSWQQLLKRQAESNMCKKLRLCTVGHSEVAKHCALQRTTVQGAGATDLGGDDAEVGGASEEEEEEEEEEGDDQCEEEEEEVEASEPAGLMKKPACTGDEGPLASKGPLAVPAVGSRSIQKVPLRSCKSSSVDELALSTPPRRVAPSGKYAKSMISMDATASTPPSAKEDAKAAKAQWNTKKSLEEHMVDIAPERIFSQKTGVSYRFAKKCLEENLQGGTAD